MRGGAFRQACAFAHFGFRPFTPALFLGRTAFQFITERGQRPDLFGKPRHFGKPLRDGFTFDAHLPIQRLGFAAHRFQRRLGCCHLRQRRAPFAFQIADACFGALARFGQFRLAAAQLPLQPRGIAAGAFSARKRFSQLPFRDGGAVCRIPRGQFQIRKPRPKPIAFPAQPITFAGEPIAFVADQGKGLQGRIARGGGAAQIIIQPPRLLAQLLPLCGFQGKQFRQFSNTAIERIHCLFAGAERDRKKTLRQHKHQQHEDDDHEQRGKRIHIARPDIQIAAASAPPFGRPRHIRLVLSIHHRGCSSAMAAMVRVRILISLRMSLVDCARPCPASSTRRAI